MLLLSKKSFEKYRKQQNGGKTRENRISLTRWKKKKKIKFCRCRNRCLFDCNQFQPFSQSNREGVSSSLTNAKNHTFLFFSFSSFTNCCEQADFKPLFTFLLFNNPQIEKKKQNKTKQIQNMLCKCGWDFDHFDQFDQNHAFSNHNPKRMTIVFVLRELLTIIKHCKNEKQNEWSWNFISFLVCFHHCRKEKKEKIVKFIFILQQTTSIHSHSFNIIKPITAITIKPRWEWEEEKVKMNIINNHRTNRNPIV